MALENLRQNVDEEREITGEILLFGSQIYESTGQDRELIASTINALLGMLKIINNSIPSLVENTSPVKKLGKQEVKEVKGLVSLSYKKGGIEKEVTISEKDKKKFLDELRLLDFSVKKIQKTSGKGVIFKEFKKPSIYAKISNKFFSNISNSLVARGYFKSLSADLRKANMPFIINTYVAIIFFSVFISSILAALLFIFLIFFSLSINFPFIFPAEISLSRILINFLICLAVPVIAFLAFYFYPYTEKESLGKRINQELPFVVIHMSAIAGSGIEPTQIFKIIVLGKEYPYMKQEIRKVINQVNFFGYDLVSALRNSAKTAPSTNLSELFNGLATAISSGGSMTEFLDKRAETLLLDYKLEREKSTKLAESFMDIYISVVIAAPMVMMLLMILMSIGLLSIGLSLNEITLIIISIVALINVIFLVFLHLKQPTY